MIHCDVVIVGAGPAGLFQVFELGLLGIRAHVVDSTPQAGGQCAELYPDKPIYDIPAIPVCDARELVARLQAQNRPFAPSMHTNATVVSVKRLDDGRFALATNRGIQFDAGAVIIAGGLGAFLPRKLGVPGAEVLEGKSLHYKVTDAHRFDGKDIVIAGGGDAALDWTLALVDRVRSLVLIHHSDKFRAAPAHVALMHELCEAQRMQLLVGDVVGLDANGDQLHGVRVRVHSGVVQRIETEDLLVFWGLHPALGPIAQWGIDLDQQQVKVNPATLQTSVPGIYAIGDIASYPGKKKLILSAFHEAALCAFAVKEHLNPGEQVHLQYTTTSPLMHRRLGVRLDPEGHPVAATDTVASATAAADPQGVSPTDTRKRYA